MLRLSRGGAWEKAIGGVSRPGKMPGISWGISAARCHIGTILYESDQGKDQKNTVCGNCYARKGTYMFPAVQSKMEGRYKALFNPDFVPGFVAGVRQHTVAGDLVRLHDSGDFQSLNHLLNVLRICGAVRDVLFWAPTREASLLAQIDPDDVPENLVLRLSGNLIDGKPPKGWPYTSTVVTDYDAATCPSSKEGGSCTDAECSACWDRDVKNVKYLKH